MPIEDFTSDSLLKRIAQLEQQLEELTLSNTLYKTIVEQLPFGVQVFDKDGFSYKLNEKQREILGLPNLQEGVGKFNVLNDPYSKAMGVNNLFEQAYLGEIIDQEIEYNLAIENNKWNTRRDKRYLSEYIFPVKIREKVEFVVSVIRDITDNKYNELDLLQDRIRLKQSNDEYYALYEEFKAQSENLFAAKERIEQSEMHFSLLVDNSPVPIFIQTDSKFSYLNKAAVNLYGVNDQADLVGKSVLDRIHPDFRDLVKQRINALNEYKKTVENIEYKHLKIDDTSIDVEVSAVPFTFKDKQGAVVFVKDISDRKSYELKIKQNLNLLKNLAEQVPGVVYQYRLYPDGKSAFPYSSPGMYEIYEVTPEEVQYDASPVFSRLHPDDLDYIIRTINESAKNQSVYHSEFRVVLPEQGIRWRECNAKPELLDDGSTLWHGIITDISHRKELEEKIRLRNEEFENFFNCALDLLCIASLEGKFIRLNREWENVLGYAIDELEGTDYINLVHPEDRDATLKVISKLDNEEKIFNFTNRYLCKNGNYRWIEWRSYPYEGKIYAAARDITERKEYHEALVQKNNELTASEEEIRAANEELIATHDALKENERRLQQINSELEKSIYKHKELEARLEFALTSSQTGAWDLDLNDHTAIRTLQHDRIFGYEKLLQEWTYEMFLNHVVEEHRKLVDEKFRKAIEQKTVWDFECQIKRIDGEVRWIWATGQLMLNNKDDINRMAGIVQDITERKEKEQALKQSHQLMQYIIEHNRSAVAVHDRDLNYLFVSNSYLKQYDVKEKNIIGKHHYEIFPDLPEKWKVVHKNALQGIVSSSEDDIYYRKDGQIVYTRWECRPWFEATGRVGGIIVYTEVINDRKLAELELKAAKERAEENEKKLIEAQSIAKMGSWELDLVTNTLHWSDEIFRIFHCEPNEFKATYEAFLEFIHPSDRAMVDGAYRNSLITRQPYELEHRIVTKDKSVKYVLEKCDTIYNDEGNPLKSFGVVIDISKRVEYESALKETNKSLQDLIYVASHDLQVPLVSIEGYASELLQSYGNKFDEEARYCLVRLQNNAQRMHKLVLSLLDLSRLNTVKNPYERIDLFELVDKIIKDLGLTIEKSAATVNVDKLPIIQGDKQRIESVFRNLIVNSIMYEGKTIWVGFENGIIFVADNGIGLPIDQLEKIFAPGERLKVNKAEGVGMGLTFCKKVVEQHGGMIWAHSEGIGRGTRINIDLNNCIVSK